MLVLLASSGCRKDEPEPDTLDLRIASYPYSVDTYITGYTVLITGLVPNTTYYARAYVITRDGTVYGNELSFTTPADLSGEEGAVTDIEGNTYRTIESGFTALPGGARSPNGIFYDIGTDNFFWSSTGNGTGAWYRVQSVYGDFNFRGCLSIGYGGSLRCVKD